MIPTKKSLLLLIMLGFISMHSSAKEDLSKEEILIPEKMVSNQVVMYRMLNSQEGVVGDSSHVWYHRRWKKQRHLQWLANRKNLMIPGIDNDYDEEAY